MPKDFLSERQILDAAERYHADHGKWPHAQSGDAEPYLGEPISWGALNASLIKGNRGLPGENSLSKLIKNWIREQGKQPAMPKKTQPTQPTLHSITGGMGQPVHDPQLEALLLELDHIPDDSSRVIDITDEILQRGWGQFVPLRGGNHNASHIECVDNPLPLKKERVVNGAEAIGDRYLTVSHVGAPPKTPYALWDAMGMSEDVLASKPGTVNYTKTLVPRAENLEVVLTDGKKGATITYTDRNSMGIPASKAPSTILEVGGINKTVIPYHIGAKGMGGTTLCTFSSATLISSIPDAQACKKMHGDATPHGWVTVIRKLKMSDGITRYCYLADLEGNVFVLDPTKMQEREPGSLLEDMHTCYEAMGDEDYTRKQRTLKAVEMAEWQYRPARPGTRVTHYDYDLGNFNTFRALGDEMYRLYSTYVVRAPHAFRLRDCRRLDVWEGGPKRNWKYHRDYMVRGLRARLEASDNTVFGKAGEGMMTTSFTNPSTGAHEKVNLRLWIVKRQNEELGGLPAVRTEYKAEKTVRKALRLGEEDPLLLDQIEEKLAKLSKKAEKGKLTKADAYLEKCLTRVQRARTNANEQPVLSFIVGEKGAGARHPRGALYTLFGITHHTETSYSFWREVGLPAMQGRAIVEISLEDCSPECLDKLISPQRESIRTSCAEYKEMVKAVHAKLRTAAASGTRLRSIYDEIVAKSNEGFSNTDRNLKDRIDHYVRLVEDLKVKPEENKQKQIIEWPVGESDDGALHVLEIVIPKSKLKKDNTVYIRKPKKVGKHLKGGTFTLRLYGDAKDGYQDGLNDAMVVIDNASARVVGSTAFSKGHADITIAWDGGKLQPGDEGELFLVVPDPVTGHTTSNRVNYQVADKARGRGTDETKTGDVLKRPDIKVHAVTRNDWKTGDRDFDASTVAAIDADKPNNVFHVYVNVDNGLLRQEMLKAFPKNDIRDKKYDSYLAWIAGFLYSMEYGKWGHDNRTLERGFSQSVLREEHAPADYNIALRMFIADLPKPKKNVALD